MVRYIKAMRDKSELKELYSTEAEIYDERRISSYDGKITQRFQIDFLEKEFKLKKNMKVLEAGCGTGRILISLAAKGMSCYGIDPADGMLEEAAKKSKKMGIKVKFKKGDIEKIPYPDNYFDRVYTMHVLMHLPDYKKAIDEMYRVLKPGGVLIVDFPNADSIWTMLSVITIPFAERTRLFTIKELRMFFEKYNFKISGIFSYARTLYKIPLLRYVVLMLEKGVPLPVSMRAQIFVIVKKN